MIKKSLIIITLLLPLLLIGQNAFAHATPITYEPESSALLNKVPDSVRIKFSERIEPNASDIKIFGPDGSLVNKHTASVDSSDSRVFSVDMKDGGQGTYTVSWQVVSADDGHFTKGAFTFSVGKETQVAGAVSGQIQIQHITTVPQAVTEGIELLGQSLLIGALILLVLLWRPLLKRFNSNLLPHRSLFEKKFALFLTIGCVLIFIGVASFLIIKTFDLQQLRVADFWSTFKTFIGTVDGKYTLFRGILGVAFLTLFWFRRRTILNSERVTKSEYALLAMILLMMLARARVSHAAASHFHPVFSIFVNFAHLFFKDLWVGGLIALVVLFIPIFSKIKEALITASLLTSFSRLMSVVFGGIGITGVYIVWLHLKGPQFLFTTEWGERFIILSIFAVFLVFVRFYHQIFIDRAAVNLAKGVAKDRLKKMLSWVNYTLPLEMFIGIAVLFVTSFLIITTPPFPGEQFSFIKQSVSQGAQITLTTYPYESKNFLLTVADEKTKKELSLNDIVVTLTNDEKGIGPIVANTEERFVGGYAFSQNLLSPSGKWKIDVSARREGSYDSVASFLVDYPKEIVTTRIDPDRRTFGVFEVLMIIMVLGIFGTAFILYRLSAYLSVICTNLEIKTLPEEKARFVWRPWLSWAFGFVGLLIISTLVYVSYAQFLKTDFQRLCERDGNFWLQSVPMRDGVALSSDTVTGCTLNIGLYHFTDEREYSYFSRPRQSAVEITTLPEKPLAGQVTQFSVNINTIEQGRKAGPVNDLGIYHDRILHMIIVGEDLKTFAHIHTEDLGLVTPEMKKDGRFPLRYVFPRAGHYTLVVNYVVGGHELSQQSFIDVSGTPQMEKNADAVSKLEPSLIKSFGEDEVTLETPATIKAGDITKFTYVIKKDGKPVTDLQPYLGAAMHIAVVRADLGRVIHTHGQVYLPGSAFFQQLLQNYVRYHSHFVPDSFGPKIQANITFPQPGLYQLFGEFKHEGKIITTSFAIKVE